MAEQIQIRRGTAAAWTAAGTLLTQGEFGLETDTGKLKIGDGVTTWLSLPYILPCPTFTTTVSGLVPAPGAVHGYFLRDDGTWDTISGVTTSIGSSTNGALTVFSGTSGSVIGQYSATGGFVPYTTTTGIAESSTTTAELGYLHGVTSAIQTQINAKQATGNYLTSLSGDGTATGPGSGALTLATVNASPGSYTSANITVNAKGLITAVSNGAGGTVTNVSGSAPITSTGGATPVIGVTSGNLSETTSAVLTIFGGAAAVLGSGTTIQVNQASGSQSGYLTSTDWSTFNSKQTALGFTPAHSGANSDITSLSGLTTPLTAAQGGTGTTSVGNLTEATSAVLSITGGTGSVIGAGATIQVNQASGSQSGYLTSTDWSTFNSKQAALGYTPAHSGANSDITSLTGLSTPLTVGQGGTGTGAALTAGSVVFAGASGVYSQNNSLLFWDNTNYRLGVGSQPLTNAAMTVVGTNGMLQLSDVSTTLTNKASRLTCQAYDTTQSPAGVFQINSQLASNALSIGGGSTFSQACTAINFFTASAVNTSPGTARMGINATGLVTINGGSTAWFSIKGDNTTANFYIQDTNNYPRLRSDSSYDLYLRNSSNTDVSHWQSSTGALALGTGTIASAQLEVDCASATTVGLLVKGAASQSGNLLTLNSSGSTTVASVTAGGKLTHGGEVVGQRTITSNPTIADSDYTFFCNAVGGAFAPVLIQGSTAAGRILAFVKIDSSANAVTVTAFSGDTINGASTYVLSSQYSRVTVQSTGGTAWYIIA